MSYGITRFGDRRRPVGLRIIVLALLLGATLAHATDEDPFGRYVKTAPEFSPLASVRGRFETWYYMPWRYRWTIGTDDAAGKFCRDMGINGGFLDYGRGPLSWMEKWKLRFYVDHTAGKGTLHLRGAPQVEQWRRFQDDPRSVRKVPLDAAALAKMKALLREHLARVKKSPMRLAYALDDEPSWSTFLRPMCWRVHGDDAAYAKWLAAFRGRPQKPRFVTPDFTRRQLGRQLKELDFSPLLERMTYNDSVLANTIGALVEEANRIDPDTPCGIVGSSAPSLWGGYDYAKIMAKVQFIEPYDVGSAPEIVRSLGRRRGVRVVSTHFPRDRQNEWQAWFRFAHGQEGMIGWIRDWFDEQNRPQPWVTKFGKTLRELTGVQGPKLRGAKWMHDGIALYYSHPSVQVSWVLDSEAHGNTWKNRNEDHLLGTASNVRRAWETMLADSGLQYDFLSYDRLIREGVPDEYKVLVLPACFALSDTEAARIKEFHARGGRVVADFMCGLFDAYGKGRAGGALDDLFGVKHTGDETNADFFGPQLWVETNQDKGYGKTRWRELLETSRAQRRGGFGIANNRLKGPVVRDRAVFLNLSPQQYLYLREEGRAKPRHRERFVKWLGVPPPVRVTGDANLEITRWKKNGRVYLFVVQNAVRHANGKFGVRTGETDLELIFARPVKDLRDERTGKKLGERGFWRPTFVRTEAVFLSYRE